mgnify:CR=1 FL=1
MAAEIRPVNAKGKRFSWSFSAINDFETCPYQYAAKRFYETVKFEDTVATLWGSRAHTALENRMKHGTPLPEGMVQWEQYCRVLEKKQGLMLAEQKICFNLSGEPVDWFAPDAWARGMIDVLIIDGDTAYIYDWKTGKKKDNNLQLETFVWFVAHQYPEIENFVTRFIWLKEDIEGDRATGRDFTRSEHLNGIELKLGQYLTRMGIAWREQVFQPKESGLCRGWCPVEECRFHKEKR